MGRILFIRVSAETYDERDVPKAWPVMYATVWPDPGVAGVESPAKLARKLVSAPNRGVLELVDNFVEYVGYVSEPADRAKALKPYADKLEQLRAALDEALGNRDVPKAHTLTNSIEDALDEAEKALREAPSA